HFAAAETATSDLSVSSGGKDPGVQIIPASFAGLTVEVVKGVQEEPVQGWVNGPWRPAPTALYHWTAQGRTTATYVVHPTAAGAPNPVVSVQTLPVTDAQGQPARATACAITFADGSRHLYCTADKDAGTVSFGGCTTDGRCALVALDAKGEVTRTILAEGKLLAGK
ncbi:MAG: hypothetical protein WCP21_17565, partial [Armatimonadota bacterium]